MALNVIDVDSYLEFALLRGTDYTRPYLEMWQVYSKIRDESGVNVSRANAYDLLWPDFGDY